MTGNKQNGGYITPHFSLLEMTQSQTASRLGIPNNPGQQERDNLLKLCQHLETIRNYTGAGIIVTSGYRCEALNEAVGGSAKSRHIHGMAADIMQPRSGDARALYMKIAEMKEQELDLPFDKVILEYDSWVHYQIAGQGREARGEMFEIG